MIGGVTFGPYDTVLTVGGLLFVIAGLASIGPMRGAGRIPAAGSAGAAAADAGSASAAAAPDAGDPSA